VPVIVVGESWCPWWPGNWGSHFSHSLRPILYHAIDSPLLGPSISFKSLSKVKKEGKNTIQERKQRKRLFFKK